MGAMSDLMHGQPRSAHNGPDRVPSRARPGGGGVARGGTRTWPLWAEHRETREGASSGSAADDPAARIRAQTAAKAAQMREQLGVPL